MRLFLSNINGNISVLFAVTAGVLVLGAAVAIESGDAVAMKSKLQDSLDAAALYSAQFAENEKYERTQFIEEGEHSFDANFGLMNVDSLNFSVSEGKLVATASVDRPVLFKGVLKKKTLKISTRSVVTLPSVLKQRACIIALTTTEQNSLLLNGSADVTAHNCEVHTHSTADPAAVFNRRTNLKTPRACIAGTEILDRASSGIGSLELGCTPEPDPYLGKYPIPDSSGCDYTTSLYNDAQVRLSPGVYCGFHNFQNDTASVTLDPGTYIIRDGGWNANGGDWEGDGVTFYFVDSSVIQVNLRSKVRFTAPTSGDYNGVLMTETPGLDKGSSNLLLDGESDYQFEGIIYLPSREVIMNSRSTLVGDSLSLVADKFIFNNIVLSIGTEKSKGGDTASAIFLSE